MITPTPAALSDQEIEDMLRHMSPQFRLGHAAARKEAEEEIAQLRRERDEAREALKPFAALADTPTVEDGLSFGKPDVMIYITRGFTVERVPVSIFSAARSALAGRKEAT